MVPSYALQRLAGALLALLLCPVLVLADTLDDNLQTGWESLWVQDGIPRQVFRWNKPITYRIHGPDSARHAAHIRSAVEGAAALAGMAVLDVSNQADAAQAASLDLEVVANTALRDNEPCFTQPQRVRDWAFERVNVRMRSSDAWRCAYHEVMHVMGIPGHPSGKTVLSYFPYRSDTFMDLDRVMLTAWYSPDMPMGASPLRALVVISAAMARQPGLSLAPDVAQVRADAFVRGKLREMQALASGQGEVPSILLRSGKAQGAATIPARRLSAYFVGLAYEDGVIVTKDPAAASPWFERAAQLGHSGAQVRWARDVLAGIGVAPDPVAAHRWLSAAAKQGNAVARKELADLEAGLTPEQLQQAQSASLPRTEGQ
jgi:hypothetical protein